MATAIRFLVHVVSSEFDRNGNRSHFATLTSVKTGKSLCVKDMGGQQNMRYLLARYMGEKFDINFPNVYTTECTIGVRDFKQAQKSHSGVWETAIDKAAIESLESST